MDVKEDTDFDGDEILLIKVVYFAENDRPDPSVTTGFIGYLRPKLSELGIEKFPVISYISKQDSESVAARSL